MVLALLLILSAPAGAQLTLESAAAQLRVPAAAFAAKERKPFIPVGKDAEEDWLPEQDELCKESKALDAWAPALTVESGGKAVTLKLAFKGCHTVDRTVGETVTPVAMRLYASPDGRWGLILSTEKGAEKSAVTLVQHDGRQAWRTSAQLGERPIKELLAKAKDYGTVKIEKFPSGVAIQSAANLKVCPDGDQAVPATP